MRLKIYFDETRIGELNPQGIKRRAAILKFV
jgi:hypothetical protein